MKTNDKQRAAKEAIYAADNKDARSVCNGRFFIKNKGVYEDCKNCKNCYKYNHYKDKSEDTPEVHFHYVSNFRNCDFYKYRPIDESYIITTSIYNMMYVNDLAGSCIIELADKIKDQDKETQRIWTALIKRQREYEKNIGKILTNDLDFFAEYNLNMDEMVQDKVLRLTSEIGSALKENSVDNYGFIALTEVMRTMVGYSVMNVENRVKECLKVNKDSVNLRAYKMSDMLRVAEDFSNWVCRKCKGIDLNKCEDVMTAYRDLDKALNNFEVINEALFKAKNLYGRE